MNNSEKQSEFYGIKNKYLAISMAFLGFSFYKYDTDGFTIYSFKKTKEFERALTLQLDLKNQFCKR